MATKLINRILIVGLGSSGIRHLRLARELFQNAEIKVLRHQVQSAIPEFSDGCLSTIEEALQFAPQIAIITNPSPFHVSTAERLVRENTHFLIEKPLSSSVEGIFQLIETCKKYNSALMVGYNLRYSPSLQQFRTLLSRGIIGATLSVRCDVGQYLPSWRPESDYRQGVSAKSELGGGALLELSHELDYLRWIFGEIEWVRATLSRQSQLEIDVEDSAHLTVGFMPQAGKQQLIGAINLDFIRHDYSRSCTAIGEKGSLRWNGITGEVELFEERANSWRSLYIHLPGKDETYVSEWLNFLDFISKKEVPIVTGEDGLRVIEIIEAARFSAPTGVQVMVSRSIQIDRLSL